MLLRIRERGWRPLQDTLDYVLWCPRSYNVVADHAVNVTLDEEKSWTKLENVHLPEDAQLRLCVDGGLRRKGDAAAGMAVFLFEGGRYTLVARGGLFLG